MVTPFDHAFLRAALGKIGQSGALGLANRAGTRCVPGSNGYAFGTTAALDR